MKYTKRHNGRKWRKKQNWRKAIWLKYKNQHNHLMNDHYHHINKRG